MLKAFDLAREMTRRTRKMPRDLKFVLGDRMLAASYDVLDLLIEAKYSRHQGYQGMKGDLLPRANLTLERLRFQARLCMEERLINLSQYEYVSGLIQEVGSMIGGWIRSLKELKE